MTPECRRADERLLDFVYEELPAEERAEVAAHVEACGRCAAELRSIGGTRAMLRALPDEEPSQAVTARLLHEAAAPRTLGERLRAALSVFAVHPAWSLGAASAVVLLGSLVLFRDSEVAPPGVRDDLDDSLEGAPGPAHERVALPVPAQAPVDKDQAAAPQEPQAAPVPLVTAPPSTSPARSRGARASGSAPMEGSARKADHLRAKSAPFAEMKSRRLNAGDDPLGSLGSGSGGAGASAPAAAAAPEPRRAEADELDDLVMGAAGRPVAEELHRGADERRARGDCPGALVLYRRLLRDHPHYPRRTEVERSIVACEAAKPASGTKN